MVDNFRSNIKGRQYFLVKAKDFILLGILLFSINAFLPTALVFTKCSS